MPTRHLNVVLDLDSGSYSGKMTQAGRVTKELGGKIDDTNAALRRMSSAFDTLSNRASSPLAKLRDYVLVLGSLRFAFMDIRDIGFSWIGGMIKQSAEVERLTMLMRGLSDATTDFGKTQEAVSTLREIFDLSRKTGFAVDALADGFVKMKSAGLDPLDGSLRNLTDAVATFGGTSETMHRATIAIQQMAGKGVISMEELRQQLGEAVPTAIKTMASAMGKSVAELTKEISKGTVAAGPALKAMFDEFGRLYAGAGERMTQTLNGQLALMKTNITELSTYFTALANGMTPAMMKYKEEQDQLLADGKITIEDYKARLNEDGGLFATSTKSLRELNEALRSSEARVFIADVGDAVNSFANTLITIVKFTIEWRDAIGTALKTAAWGFIALKGLDLARWFAGVMAAGVEAFRSIEVAALANKGPMEKIVSLSQNHINISKQLKAANEDYISSLERGVNSSVRKAENLKTEVERLRDLENQFRTLTPMYDKHRVASEAALAAGKAAGRYREYETGQFISQARAIEINSNIIKAQTRNRVAATNVAKQLKAVEAELTAVQAAQSITTNRLAAAHMAAAASATLVSRAMTAAATGVRFLGQAVNLALGPIGIIAFMLYQAADAAGFFENKTNKANAALARLRQGIADTDAMKALSERRETQAKRREDLKRQLETGGEYDDSPTGFTKFSKAQIDQRKKEIQAIERQDVEDKKALQRGRTALQLEFADQETRAIEFGWTQRKNALSTQYRAFSTLQDKLEKEGKINQDQKNKNLQAERAKIDNAEKAYLQSQINQQQSWMDRQKKAGKSTTHTEQIIQNLSERMANLNKSADLSAAGMDQFGKSAAGAAGPVATMAGQVASLGAKLNGSFGALAKFNAELKAGKFAGKSEEEIGKMRSYAAQIDSLHALMGDTSSQEKFQRKLANVAGEIAQLKEELVGGEGELAKFNAQVKAGLWGNISESDVIKMQEMLSALDKVKNSKKIQDAFNDISEDSAKAKTAADGMWLALGNDTLQANKRLIEAQANVAKLVEKLKLDPADQKRFQDAADQLAKNLMRQDVADAANKWREETQSVLASLMEEDAARQRSFQLEADRRQKLIDLAQLEGEERIKAQQAYNEWHAASQKKLQRDGEGSTKKMLRDWTNLGAGIDATLSQAISGFVDGMADADLNFGKMAVSIIKQLIKIALQAIIAYAILSAIGMTPQSGGKSLSLGDFMKGQVGGGFNTAVGNTGTVEVAKHHQGGAVGRDIKSLAAISSNLFNSAQIYHSGGMVGKRPLMPGERPILAKDGEVVLNEAQQGNLASKLNKSANVTVNLINNSGTEMSAEASEPRFDHDGYIIDVVVAATQRPGRMREALRGLNGK